MLGEDVVADVDGVHEPLGLHVVERKLVPDRGVALKQKDRFLMTPRLILALKSNILNP